MKHKAGYVKRSLLPGPSRVLACLALCWAAAAAFLVEEAGHDETLTMAFQALQQLSAQLQGLTADNQQLRDRLAALEADHNNNRLVVTQTMAQLQTDVANLGSRVSRDFIWSDDEWAMVFRATSGISQPVYDAWVNKGHHDDDPMVRATLPCGCTTVNGSLPCDRHYRSRLLDSWPSSSIDEIKLALYENGVEVEHVTFTGTGSDYMNWFSQSRIVESSWTDLKTAQNVNIFSIAGHDAELRRFFINHVYLGCPGDVGWMVVKDKADDTCAWATVQRSPAFLYSPSSHDLNWEAHGFREADVMAVFVKFRPTAEMSEMCLN